MCSRRLVEGGGEHLAFDRAADVGDFLGPLADEHDHDVDVGVVSGDAVGDVFQELRLSGFRRRHDQRTLSVAERVHEIDESLRKVRVVDLEVEHLVREDRDHVLEDGPPFGLLGVDAVHGLDTQEAEVLLAVFRRTGLAGHEVAGPKTETADLARADVDVLW